jgi:hypothetical protein
MKEDMKEKLIRFWNNVAEPFLKTERGLKTWVIVGIAIASFIAGAILF